MGLQREGRRIFEQLVRQRMARLDRLFFHAREERFFPTMAQLAHVDIFLAAWERLVIAGAAALGIIALVGVVWSVRTLTTVEAPADGGSFKEALVGEPQTINPLFAASDTDRALSRIIFLPLCKSSGYTGPALADNCTVNENSTRATIALNDRRWHDGVTVTPQDVLFTIQAMQSDTVGSPWQTLADKISASVDAQNHIVLSATRPLPELQTLIGIGIIPEHIWKTVDPAHMRSNQLNVKPIGSGPYKFENATADAGGFLQSMTLRAFDDFKPAPPHLQEITFRFAIDADTAKDMFSSRSVDAWASFDPTDGDAVYKHDVRRYELTPPVVISLFFNPARNGLFKNAGVRDAISLVIDRTAIVKNALKSGAIPTRVPFPSTILGGDLSTLPDTNVDTAREELKKALPRMATTTLTLGIPVDSASDAVGKELIKNLSTLGITVQPRAVDLENAPADAAAQDLLLAGQAYETPTAVFPYWHSSGSGAGGANYARYEKNEVDRWLESLLTEPGTAQRAILLKKISNRIVADTPAVFLYQPVYEYFVAQKFRGILIEPGTTIENRFAHIADWYVNTKHVKK